jgi:hypothetical protein
LIVLTEKKAHEEEVYEAAEQYEEDEDGGQVTLKLPTYPAPPVQSKLHFFRVPNALHFDCRTYSAYVVIAV